MFSDLVRPPRVFWLIKMLPHCIWYLSVLYTCLYKNRYKINHSLHCGLWPAAVKRVNASPSWTWTVLPPATERCHFFQCVCPAASGMIYSFIPSMQNVCACPDQGFIERHPRQLKQTVTDAIWSLSNGCCLKRCHSNLNTNRMRSQSANSYERQMYKNSWHNPPP